MTAGPAEVSPFQQTLRTYLKAGYPILYVVTAEEQRAIDLISGALADEKLSRRKPFVWSVSRGLCTLDLKSVDQKTADPKRILPYLQELKQPGVFILEDFHNFIDERSPSATLVVRQMRDLVGPFQATQKTLVVLSPVLKIPPEIEKDVTVVDLGLPDESELAGVLDETVESVKDRPHVEINLDGDGRERVVKALCGLTQMEAENALAKVVVTRSRLDAEDIDLLLAEKEQVIRKSGILEFYASPERFGSIGGLENLKEWLRRRGKAFSEAARDFPLPYPKGLLLVGVPGCGKSLTAKAVAAEWRMPLLKFDLGKVFGPLVGQAEDNMRKALKMGQAVAPCVLWIDEIEKGLAGSRGGGQGDSGVAARVFGTLLTWMEENKQPVFVVATANDIAGTPPELLRKGRFDEVFFVDLPSLPERALILAIHLTRQRRDHRDFDLARHAAAAEGFSGAELEQVVVEAMFSAFAEGEKTRVEDRHLEKAIAESVPLSQSMGPRIAQLRELAKGWRIASKAAEEGARGAEVVMPEPPPVPPKRKRIFEV
ncbi:MAG: AAA family ATPase [Acidobacteria bacterium]|nr:AAA family ATPase [Acidobacteriota bacterium]